MVKKIAVPALAAAAKNNWTMTVANVDPPGNLVYYEKVDNTRVGQRCRLHRQGRAPAPRFKRPTKAFLDALSGGGEELRVLRIEGAVLVEGAFPLVMDGKIVGAIGVSGGTSAQDSECAKAAATV